MITMIRKDKHMNAERSNVNEERMVQVLSGWVMLLVAIVLLLAAQALLIYSIVAGVREIGHPNWALFVLAMLMEFGGVLILPGLFTLQPNEARVLILFGAYKGTVRDSGFHWGNPFYSNKTRSTNLMARLAEFEGKVASAKKGEQRPERSHLSRNKISLRARTLNGEILKVNDKRGNPV